MILGNHIFSKNSFHVFLKYQSLGQNHIFIITQYGFQAKTNHDKTASTFQYLSLQSRYFLISYDALSILFFITLSYHKNNGTVYIMIHTQYRYFHLNGLDESRTRVRRKIPCPSTSVVCSLTFPLRPGNKHPERFSSFIIRPLPQSFDSVVSHIVEAGILRCECPRADCCH